MPKFFIKTYGCQMNVRDSEQVAHSLVARGYERVTHEAELKAVLMICVSRLLTSRRNRARNRRFAISNSRRGRRRRLSPSCKVATCAAHFASCRRRAGRNEADP